jgi:hypothetical protein
MSQVPFDSLPDEARVWCFAAEPEPGPRETARILDAMHEFVDQWTAHRENLSGAVDWWHQRFLLVGLDETRIGASGCSIDALMARLAELESELGILLTESSPVWYRDADDRIRSVPRDEFRRLAGVGAVGPETRVFDLTVKDMAAARASRLERRAAETWHARLL